MNRERLMRGVGTLVPVPRRPVLAGFSRRHGRRRGRNVSRSRQRRARPRRPLLTGRRVASRARRRAPQRSRRSRASGRVVAPRRQLGPRRRARQPTTASRAGPGDRDGRHANHRARHLRRRLHVRPENPDRADTVSQSGRSLLRVARLPGVLRSRSRMARRHRRRGTAESGRTDRGCGRDAASTRDLDTARRRRCDRNQRHQCARPSGVSTRGSPCRT
jgi:hypothetical protein